MRIQFLIPKLSGSRMLLLAAILCLTEILHAQDLKLLPQQGHARISYAMAAHPNGRWVATAENDIRIWDIYSRRVLRVFKDFDESQYFMAFTNNPKSNLLLSTGSLDNKVYLWDIEKGELIKTFMLGYDFSPSSIEWIGDENETPTEFYVMGYKEFRKYNIHKDQYVLSSTINDEHLDGTSDNTADEYGLYDLDLVTKASRLKIIPEINSIALRNYDTLMLVPLEHSKQNNITKLVLGSHLYNMDYCASQNLLALATDLDFQLYDLDDNSLVYREKNLWNSYEHNIKISKNGKLLFLDYSDSAAVVDWASGRKLLNLTPSVQIAEFTHNDEYLITGGWSSPFVFNIATRRRQDMTVFEPSVFGIKVHGNSMLELKPATSQNQEKVYFDLKNLEFAHDFKIQDVPSKVNWNTSLNQISITNQGRELHSFTLDFKVNGIKISDLPAGEEKVGSRVLSADDKYLYIVEIFVDPRTTERRKKLNAKNGYVSTPLSGYKRRVAKYECSTGKLIARSKPIKDWASYTLRMSEDGKTLSAESMDDVFILSTKNLKRLADLSPEQPKNWSFPVKKVIHMQSQERILVFQEWKLHIWSSKTYKLLKTIPIDFRYLSGDALFQDSVLVLAGTEGKHNLVLVHLPTLQLINWVKTGDNIIRDIDLIDDVIVMLNADGSLKFWRITNWSHVVDCIIDRTKREFAIYMQDGRYYGTKSILKYLRMTEGLKSYSVSQFDNKFNKPHEVLSDLVFVEKEKIDLLKRLHDKRLEQYSDLKKVDLKAAPRIEISNLPFETNYESIRVRIKGDASPNSLDRLEIWANGVPLYGSRGLKLKHGMSQLDTVITVDLLRGNNELVFSLRDKDGRQSSKEKRLITCLKTKSKDSLIVICIATSNYRDKSYNLKYAVKDGRDIIETFQKKNTKSYSTFGNHYSVSKYHLRVDTLFDEAVSRSSFMALAEKIKHCRPQDKVIISMSGHGLLDSQLNWWFATYSMNFNQPQEAGISYDMIMRVLEQSPSRHKTLLLDACHSGELDRSMSKQADLEASEELDASLVKQQFKGAKVTRFKKSLGLDNSYELMKEYFLDMNDLTGVHVISAASGDSYALESDAWQNGVFSHCVIKAISGEDSEMLKNGLTITELQKYVSAEVQRLTRGKQKPMTRAGNPEFDFALWW